MKLRGKLVFLESTISLIFFLVLIMILLGLNRGFQIYDYIDDCKEINNLNMQLISESEVLLLTYNPSEAQQESLWNNFSSLTNLIADISTHRFLKSFSESTKVDIATLNEVWEKTHSQIYPSRMSRNYAVYEEEKKKAGFESQTLNQLLAQWKDLDESEIESWQADAIETGENLNRLYSELRKMSVYTQLLRTNIALELDNVRFNQIRRIAIWGILAVILTFVIVIMYMNSLLNKIRFIKKALDNVAEGDLSARLMIRSNDEFGKLSRDFNTVVEFLWSKLETVQNILEDVGKSISNEINLERAEKAIIYLARKNSSADGVAYFKIKGESSLTLAHVQGAYHPPFLVEGNERSNLSFSNSDDLIESFRQAIIPLEGNLLGDTAKSGEAIFIKDVAKKQLWLRDASHPYFISSLINLPLRVGNRVLGVLSLTKNNKDELFSDLEFTNMLSFGELASISIDNLLKYQDMIDIYELNREIDIAADIQKDLLPQSIPHIPGLDLSISSRTLRGINGDFYDAFLLSNNKLLVVISEVAGKGVPAALVIIMLKTIIKLVARPDKNAAEIISELNMNITEKIKIENIATLSLMIIDDHDQTMSYASAGHQPMVVYKKSTGEIQEIQPKGIPVGLDKNAEYEELKIQLDKDSIYLQFTDGVPETMDRDGKTYGIRGMNKVLNKFSNESSDVLKTELLDDLEFFQRETQQWDDQTLLVMKKEV